MSDWTEMRRSDFDTALPLTLFDIPGNGGTTVKPDKHGTPDLFTALED